MDEPPPGFVPVATGDRDDPRVWSRPARVGYGQAVEGAGLTAAPLLAGFSFTLLTLVISADDGGSGLSAVPELAALLFLVAGLLLVFCVQFAFRTRGFTAGPGALADWMPEETAPASDPGAEEGLASGSWESWTLRPRLVGDRWVSGRLRRLQREQRAQEARWSALTRWSYNCGIITLLGGLTALLVPPDADERLRVAGAVIAGAVTIAELTWVISDALAADEPG
jgi:hypothetical protein